MIFESGKTQRQLAKEIGIGEATLSLIVNGAWIPSLDHQTKIAAALNVKPEDLFDV